MLTAGYRIQARKTRSSAGNNFHPEVSQVNPIGQQSFASLSDRDTRTGSCTFPNEMKFGIIRVQYLAEAGRLDYS